MSRPARRAGGTLLVGSGGPLSAAVFAALRRSGVPLAGAVVAGMATRPIAQFRADGGETLASRAAAAGVPLRPGDDPDAPGLARWIAALDPEWLLVACYPHRVPAALCRLARRDALNLHPSLLPRYRGPAPLFWQLRAGERRTGVTLHRLAERLDAGPLVAARRVALPDAATGAALDMLLGEEGGALFAAAISGRGNGPLPGRPQDEARASCQGLPGPGDFALSRRWGLRRVVNFMRGTRHWGQGYAVRAGDATWLLDEALGTLPRDAAAPLRDGATRRIPFRDGVLVARGR